MSDRELEEVLDRHAGRTGAARLRLALASEPLSAIIRSEAERRFRRYRFHDSRPRWERDRHRDQRLLAASRAA